MLKNITISNKSFMRWFQRPSDPSDPWDFTQAGIDCITEECKDTPGFEFKQTYQNVEICNKDEKSFENQFSTCGEESLLDSFLKKISETEARFPNCEESKLISDTLEKAIEKMILHLQQKSDFFKDCSVLKVGSTSEELKCGSLDEFDFNLILPNLSKHIDLLNRNHNSILVGMINKGFFGVPFVGNNGVINFKLKDYDIFEGIIPKSELEQNYKRKLDEFEEQIKLGIILDKRCGLFYNEETSRKKWMDELAAMSPVQQRENLEMVFPALDRIIEETLSQSIPDSFEIISKRAVREFRSMNQVAITLNLLWKKCLNINIDFALVLPVSQKPVWYDLDVFLREEKKSLAPMIVPMTGSDENFWYIIRSYKTCRLSAAEQESEMFKKFDVDSVIKQSIRVCKKLRDIYMSHYFDVATETVVPVMPSYWIKTVAMHLFHIAELPENHDTEKTLSQSVIQILQTLHKCLTVDNRNRHPFLASYTDRHPFLASYTDPLKNLLDSASNPNENNEEETGEIYVDDDLKDITLRPNIVAANDIQRLLEVLVRLDQNDTHALTDIDNLRKANELDKKRVCEKGMKTKLGVLMYEHFEKTGIPFNERTSDDPVAYIEFIKRNFPSMEIIPLEKEEELWCRGQQMLVDVKLMEYGEEVDLKEILESAYNKINYWSVQRNDTMIDDCFVDAYWIKTSIADDQFKPSSHL